MSQDIAMKKSRLSRLFLFHIFFNQLNHDMDSFDMNLLNSIRITKCGTRISTSAIRPFYRRLCQKEELPSYLLLWQLQQP